MQKSVSIRHHKFCAATHVVQFAFLCVLLAHITQAADRRPNILFFFADDWGRNASIYRDEKPSINDVISTPHIDRIGEEGVVFENAFVPVSSCTPSRASVATARYFWNCGSRAILNKKASDWSGLEDPAKTLPKWGDALRESGYFARKSLKTFSFTQSKSTKAFRRFGRVAYQSYGMYVGQASKPGGRKKRHNEVMRNTRREMRRILQGTPEGKPFFFVFGSFNPHRPYTPDSGKELWGIDPDSLQGLLPPYLPDVEDIRRDFSDYLGEVLALDRMLGVMLDELEKAGELNNTVVILAGDNGIPGVPRGKANCYDLSIQTPLLVRWPEKIQPGRRVKDFINIMDIGPTLLELADVPATYKTDGESFYQQLTADESGWIDPTRNRVIVGRELHVHDARPGNLPYPIRAIRTEDFLYIRNFKPERWPMGDPSNQLEAADPMERYRIGLNTRPAYQDIDGSLTKAWFLKNQKNPKGKQAFELTIGKRPAEELYDLRVDPHQLNNRVDEAEYAAQLKRFREELQQVMQDSSDPRRTDAFDRLPWVDPENTKH